MYYYCIVTLSYLCSLSKRSSSLYRLLLFLIIASVLLISCFRVGFGTDYYSYEANFHSAGDGMEFLWRMFVVTIKNLGGNYHLFLALIFSIAFSLKLITFYKLGNRSGLMLSLMLYFSFYYIAYDINAIRQGLALSVTCIALLATYKRNLSYYLICMAIACFIHYTAIWFLPFYWISRIRLSLKVAMVVIISLYICAASGIMQRLMNIALQIFTNPVIASKITNYSSSDLAVPMLYSFSTIRRLLFSALIIILSKRIGYKDPISQILIWGAFGSICSYLLLSEIGYFATRLSVYYRITECIFVSYLPVVFKRPHVRQLSTLILYCYSMLQVCSALSLRDNGLTPISVLFFRDL